MTRNHSCVVWIVQRGIPEEAENRKPAITKNKATRTSDETIGGQSNQTEKGQRGMQAHQKLSVASDNLSLHSERAGGLD